MTFLIDGYNLMHAAGYLTSRPKRGRLEPARKRFLDWLADAGRSRVATLRVVFDAADAPAYSPEADHRGVRVRFAYRQTADDLIETMLRDADAGGVVVVSNDGRLHEAARRRNARAWACERFLDWSVSAEPVPAAKVPAPPEKPEAVPADEAAELLRAFDRPR